MGTFYPPSHDFQVEFDRREKDMELAEVAEEAGMEPSEFLAMLEEDEREARAEQRRDDAAFE